MTTPQLVCYNGKLILPTYGYGLCECGCGGHPKVSPENFKMFGYIKDQPRRFIHGHQNRVQGPDYEARDYGFKTPCWIWLKLKTLEGYARIVAHGKHRRATHAYYEHHIGPVPQGMHLDHLCRVHPCVNPDHLEPVPPRVNVRRGAKCVYTEDDIKSMIEMRNTGMFYEDIARHFGSATEYIQAICYGKRWKGIVGNDHLPKKTTRTTKEQLEEMKNLRMKGMSSPDIADIMGVTQWRVYAVLRKNKLGRSSTGRHTRIKPPNTEAEPCLELPRRG